MANTYESKFKGVEVDEGVNIARNLTGTGGIEVKKTETGTINATVTIDGSGKQDTITDQTSLNVGGLKVNETITGKDLSMTGNVNIEGVQVSITGETITFDSAHDDITFKSRYNAPVVFDVAAQFKGPSGAMFYLGDTGEYVKLMPAMNGTGIYDVRLPDTGGTLALTSDIPTAGITGVKIEYLGSVIEDGVVARMDFGNNYEEPYAIVSPTAPDPTPYLVVPAPKTKTINNTSILGTGNISLATAGDIATAITGKQDKLTTSSEISIKKLQATTIGAQDNGSLTIVDPLTVSNDVYVNELAATKGTFWSGAIVQGTLTGETAHFATGVTVDGYSSFNGIYVDNSTTNPICFKRNGGIVTKMYGPTSGGGELVNVYLPGKGGTLALTSDIPTGGGGSAGVSSIGGKTGAITLGTGLTIDGNNVLDVVTHMNYVNMYLHRVIGWFDRSDGNYAIMISFYDGTEAEFTGDTLGDLIQQIFEYQYTSSIVIAKTDGSIPTSWDPTKFEQFYVGTIVDDMLYCNFNEMNIRPIRLYNIPFVWDIVEQVALPVS